MDIKVHEFTGGNGVDAVFDPIGKETFDTSLQAFKKRKFGKLWCYPGPDELGLAVTNIKVGPVVLNYVGMESLF